jgi:hypothetical protein
MSKKIITLSIAMFFVGLIIIAINSIVSAILGSEIPIFVGGVVTMIVALIMLLGKE